MNKVGYKLIEDKMHNVYAIIDLEGKSRLFENEDANICMDNFIQWWSDVSPLGANLTDLLLGMMVKTHCEPCREVLYNKIQEEIYSHNMSMTYFDDPSHDFFI